MSRLVLVMLGLLVTSAIPPAAAQDYCCDVTVPPPFDRHAPAAYVRLLYPRFDPATGHLGVLEDKQPLGGQLYDAKTWTADGAKRLVVLVENYVLEEGKRPEYGGYLYAVDLALVEDGPAGPRLVASLRDAGDHSGHGGAELDLAPYRFDARQTAVGIRTDSMHMGFEGTRLTLFLREGAAFRKVFDRLVDEDSSAASGDALEGDLTPEQMRELYESGPDILARRAKAVISVVPATPQNDLQVVERVTERLKDGRLRRATVKETWRWNAAAREYRKS
jgi:hypothetical protein